LTPTDTTPANPRLGILLMLAGIMMFSLNDTLGKWLVATYSVGQVLLIRSIAALVFLSPAVMQAGWRSMFQLDRPVLHVLRVVVSSAEVYLFYFAVMHLPLADAMTYWLAAPIYVAALSPLILGEHVGWRRWTAIFIGFCGVLIALQPSSATLSPAAIVSIIGSLAFAFMLITSRLLRGTPDVTLVFWQMVGAGLLGLITAPFGWVPAGAFDLSLLALLGVVALLAHVCVNRALKLGDASTVVPFQYTLLFWAIVFGWLVFGDVPSLHVLIGAAVIVGAGLFIFFREQKLKKPAPEVMEV
jgi:drug/metabolite transporter (DMT)-like permease